jgi:hypothetical protein
MVIKLFAFARTQKRPNKNIQDRWLGLIGTFSSKSEMLRQLMWTNWSSSTFEKSCGAFDHKCALNYSEQKIKSMSTNGIRINSDSFVVI